jgi:hypothetical protein
MDLFHQSLYQLLAMLFSEIPQRNYLSRRLHLLFLLLKVVLLGNFLVRWFLLVQRHPLLKADRRGRRHHHGSLVQVQIQQE